MTGKRGEEENGLSDPQKDVSRKRQKLDFMEFRDSAFPEHLLCAKTQAEHFTEVISLNLYNGPLMEVFSAPFYRRGN